jgi:hypothetical protein
MTAVDYRSIHVPGSGGLQRGLQVAPGGTTGRGEGVWIGHNSSDERTENWWLMRGRFIRVLRSINKAPHLQHPSRHAQTRNQKPQTCWLLASGDKRHVWHCPNHTTRRYLIVWHWLPLGVTQPENCPARQAPGRACSQHQCPVQPGQWCSPQHYSQLPTCKQTHGNAPGIARTRTPCHTFCRRSTRSPAGEAEAEKQKQMQKQKQRSPFALRPSPFALQASTRGFGLAAAAASARPLPLSITNAQCTANGMCQRSGIRPAALRLRRRHPRHAPYTARPASKPRGGYATASPSTCSAPRPAPPRLPGPRRPPPLPATAAAAARRVCS